MIAAGDELHRHGCIEIGSRNSRTWRLSSIVKTGDNEFKEGICKEIPTAFGVECEG
jgi:hypothetical protein